MIFIMAEVPHLRFTSMGEGDSIVVDTIAVDTIAVKSNIPDTAAMDSLHKAIWLRNKAVDDSLAADSANRQRKNGIDSPVEYTADDSMTYEGADALEVRVRDLFDE